MSWCPGATRVAVLVNPANPEYRDHVERCGSRLRALSGCKSRFSTPAPAARSMRPSRLCARAARRALRRHRPTFTSRRVQLVQLAARHAIPATYPGREYVEVGGLMSYGANLPMRFGSSASMPAASSRARSPPTCRWCSRPSSSWSSIDRPRRRSASKMPPSLLARADEVIE